MLSLPLNRETLANILRAILKEEKRILFITPQPFFISRGSPFRVRSTVSALTELGYDVHLLALPIGEHVTIPGLTIHRSPRVPGLKSVPIGASLKKVLWDLPLFFKALLLTIRHRPAVIHGVEEGGMMAALLGRVFKIPYIYDMHSRMSDQLAASNFFRSRALLSLFRRLEDRCIAASAGVITVGAELTAQARELDSAVRAYSLPDLPLEMEEGGETVTPERLREELNLQGRTVFLYTGNFEPYQGLDLLFAAFQRLVDTTPPADQERLHLVIVGGGTGCEHLVSTYRALIKQLGIEPFVTFTGQRPASEMGAFMNLADVLVSPRTEGNNPPLKIYSYMAMAKPIVATAISSHTQVLDESCAFMTMPTPTAFAEALRRASDPSAGSDEERALRIQEASARVNGRFGKAEFHKRLKELYSFTPVAQRSPEIAGWLITALQLLEA